MKYSASTLGAFLGLLVLEQEQKAICFKAVNDVLGLGLDGQDRFWFGLSIWRLIIWELVMEQDATLTPSETEEVRKAMREGVFQSYANTNVDPLQLLCDSSELESVLGPRAGGSGRDLSPGELVEATFYVRLERARSDLARCSGVIPGKALILFGEAFLEQVCGEARLSCDRATAIEVLEIVVRQHYVGALDMWRKLRG